MSMVQFTGERWPDAVVLNTYTVLPERSGTTPTVADPSGPAATVCSAPSSTR